MKDVFVNLNKVIIFDLLSSIYKFCKFFLKRLKLSRCFEKNLNSQVILTLIRKVILLLDAAVIFYVKSHNFDFDEKSFLILNVSEKENWFAFICSSTKLACFDAFIDRRQVWVFNLLNNDKDVLNRSQKTTNNDFYVLTKMQDFVDI